MPTEASAGPSNRRFRETSSSLRHLKDEELVQLAQVGSHGASERLILLYGPLIRRIASRYFLLGAEPEDVIQEGFVGFCKAMRTYRPRQTGGVFRTFAFLCITRQIQSAVRAAGRVKHSALNGADSITPANFCSEGDQRSEIGASSDEVESLVAEYCLGLTDFESAVLKGIATGHSYSDISKILCCPLKSVDNGIQRAKRKILAQRNN